VSPNTGDNYTRSLGKSCANYHITGVGADDKYHCYLIDDEMTLSASYIFCISSSPYFQCLVIVLVPFGFLLAFWFTDGIKYSCHQSYQIHVSSDFDKVPV
jgi:hypothetical protein